MTAALKLIADFAGARLEELLFIWPLRRVLAYAALRRELAAEMEGVLERNRRPLERMNFEY